MCHSFTVTLRVLLSLPLLLVCAVPAAEPRDPQSFTDEAIRVAAARLPRLQSLLVSRHGSLVFEYYAKGAGPARLTNVKSVSKSIISTLVGIAIDRHILESINQPIARFFPGLTQDRDPRKARITLEDLLTMRAGLESTSFDNYGAWVRSPNWVTYVLDQPLVSEPGTAMEYSTGNTHLLSDERDQGEHVGVPAGEPRPTARPHLQPVAAGSSGHLLRGE